MNPTRLTHRIKTAAFIATVAAGLAVPAAVAHSHTPTSAVQPAAGDDEHVISKTHGRGAHAARVARDRIGGGRVTRVTEDRGDHARYEVTLRKGAYRYEVDLTARFKVVDVDRERA